MVLVHAASPTERTFSTRISMNPVAFNSEMVTELSARTQACGTSLSSLILWQILWWHGKIKPILLNSCRTCAWAMSPFGYCISQPTGILGLLVWKTATLWKFLIKASNHSWGLGWFLISRYRQWLATNAACSGLSLSIKKPSGQVLSMYNYTGCKYRVNYSGWYSYVHFSAIQLQ